MPIDIHTFKDIQSIVGPDHCSRNSEEMACYAYDASVQKYLPSAIAFPKNTQEIAALVALANRADFFVTPRGSGSGTTGGALAVQGGLVLVTTRLNKILQIDTDNLVAHVEPGVMTAQIHKAVEKNGLYYPPDPSSADFSTIGGNLAECAGGPGAVKYGVTKDYVLGLQAVIGTGDIIETGVQTVKGVVGYDLTRLMVGSEGTLGIITRIMLRLLPKPETVRTMAALFGSMHQAAETVSEIIRQGIIPRTIEFMDSASIACVRNDIDLNFPPTADALLLIETDGKQAAADQSIHELKDLCLSLNSLEVIIAETDAEVDQLWQARKALSSAMFQYGPDKINEDIVVPRSKIPAMIRKIEMLQAETGLTMVNFGHAGDGNIHVHIMLDKSILAEVKAAEAAIEKVFDATLALGGTISGEHGIGIAKRPYFSKEVGPIEQEIMKKIKQVFDPKGLLNPGKIFP
jgi:glycolate oxidase